MAEELKIVIDADVTGAIAGVNKFKQSVDGLTTGSIAQLQKAALVLKTELANLSPAGLKSDFGKQLSSSLSIVTAELKRLKQEAGVTSEKINTSFNKSSAVVKKVGSEGSAAAKEIEHSFTRAFLGIRQLEHFVAGFGIGAIIGFAASALEDLAKSFLGLDAAAAEQEKFSKRVETNTEATKQKQEEFSKAIDKAADSLLNQTDKLTDLNKILVTTSNNLDTITQATINQGVAQFVFDKKNVELQKLLGAEIQKNIRSRKLLDIRTTVPEFDPGIISKDPLEKQAALARESLGTLNFLGKGLEGFFKSFTKTKDKTSNVEQDMLERARAFIKEFGGIFIVPDLEISFTNTKDQVTKAAKKLNFDIDHGLLQFSHPTREVNIPIELGLQVDDKGIKNDLQTIRDNLFKNANIGGDKTKLINGIVPGASEDVAKRNKAFFDEFQKQIQATADLVNGVLAPAFGDMFDAIIAGKNPLKAFFDGLKDAVGQLIKKLIAAVIEASILKALGFVTSGGATGFGDILSSVLGFQKAANFNLGGAIGSRAFNNVIQVNVVGQISGQQINLVSQRANNSAGRFG